MSRPPVWRGMDAETLSREYSPSSMLEEPLSVWVARYAADSAAARAEVGARARLRLRYGPGAEETLDYFPAEGPGPRPVVVFIHGGYWQALNASDASFAAPALNAEGIDYVALNYTLAPRARMDEIVAETRRAVLWLTANAARFGGDGARIVLTGHSAGAHLAAMMLAADWTGTNPGISAAALIGGIYDLEPIRLCYVNDALRMDVAETLRNSPARLRPARDVPVVVCWGARDTAEFRRQSRELAASWRAQEAWEQAGRHHFDSPLELGMPGTRLFERVCALARGGV
ncbi:MAG: alpha/beta hydrolase [Rhodobacteraceae bacterium]|nr:alpha/beta hydrolase [Paracoccaceae bacterium]